MIDYVGTYHELVIDASGAGFERMSHEGTKATKKEVRKRGSREAAKPQPIGLL